MGPRGPLRTTPSTGLRRRSRLTLRRSLVFTSPLGHAAQRRVSAEIGWTLNDAAVTATDAPGRQPSDQCVAVHAEAACRSALIPVLALEHAQHVRLLETVAGFFQREHGGLGGAAADRGFVQRQ